MVACLPGYASALSPPNAIPDEETEVTIRLKPEEPVRIRLLDLEGRPASRARLRVTQVATVFLASAPDRALPGWLGFLTADEQGRLTIPGLTRDADVWLEILDERFAVQRLRIREGRAIAGVNGAAMPTFTLTPAHWLEGRVRLGESGPAATGAKFLVISHCKPDEDPQGIRIGGRTDAEGRFRVNVPRCESHEVLVYPPDGSPFAFRRVVTSATHGMSQQIDVILPRGVLVKGRVVESPSGRAVAGAFLEYRPQRAGNPNFQAEAVADHGGREPTAVTGPDGSFRIGVLPGPGHLLVEAPESSYINVETTDGDIKSGVPGGARLRPDGLLAVDAPAGAEVEATITLRIGKALRGRMLDPTGRPATDAEIIGWDGQNPRTAGDGTFELVGLDPAKSVTVYFLDKKDQLGRVATFSGSDLDRPATVRLERCGSARARFIDAQGQPFANVQFQVSRRPMIQLEMRFAGGGPETEGSLVVNMDHSRYGPLATDAQGWVTYPTLIPGVTYRILAGEGNWVTKKEFVAEAGRTLELGEITVNPYP
jgi:hypothetical protein